MSLALLCAGQGGQHAGMFDLAALDDDGWRAFDRAAGCDLRAAAAGPARFDNAVAQPLVCAAALAVWSTLAPALARAGVAPRLVAGYSIGELAAHGCSGRLAPGDTLDLARLRAAAMDDASRPGDALVALRGIDARGVAALSARHAVHVAIVNGADLWLVGGRDAALRGLQGELATSGVQAQRLPVAVAAHTPLLATAAAAFRDALAAVAWHAPALPVVAGVDGSLVVAAPAAIDTLARQVAATIRWDVVMDVLVERGTTVALELGPGGALARLLRERHPGLATRAVEDFRSVDAIVEWVAARGDR